MTVPIPEKKAMEICKQIRSDNEKKLLSFARWQCWGCIKFSRENPAKMCFSSVDGNRGCNLINKIFNK